MKDADFLNREGAKDVKVFLGHNVFLSVLCVLSAVYPVECLYFSIQLGRAVVATGGRASASC